MTPAAGLRWGSGSGCRCRTGWCSPVTTATGQRRAFPIFDLREELGRRGALSSVISDKDDYVLAFGMSGVLRLRSTDPIEGRYELQEIDVNCGVFALLKDCNQDIVWIGTDGSGLLRQAVGEVAIRSVTYETLPYLLTKPIKALHVDPEGDLWIGTKNDGILRIRDFYSRRTFTRENTDSYTAADSPLGKNSVYTFAGSRRNVLWIGGDGGVCYYSYRHRRIFELPRSGALRRIHGLYEDRDGVLWAASVGYGVWRVELSGSADAPVAANVEPVELGLKARSRNFFFSVCEESDSTLWFCNHGIGVVHYDRRTREGRTVVVRDRLRPGALRSGGRRRGIRLQQRPAALRGDPRPAGRFARQHLGRDQCRHRALRPGDEPFGGLRRFVRT